MGKNPINISIIIPCYNDGKYIMEAIESAEQYKGNDSEMIIINDGSDDAETLAIFRKLEKKGYFVLNQKNVGLASARNNGIRLAKGKYILPLDSDNIITSKYITKSIDILENNPEIGVVYSDLKFFGEEGGIQNIDDFNISRLLVSNYIDACAVFRKQVWVDVGGYDEKLNSLFWEDWEFWLNTYKKGWKFYHIPEVLFHYRKKKESLALKALNSEKRKKVVDYILLHKHSDILLKNYQHMFRNDYKKEISTYKKKILEKDNIIKEISFKILEKENVIKENDLLIQEKKKYIHKIENLLQKRDYKIQELNLILDKLKNKINHIQNSLIWKAVSKLNKLIEFLFPLGSTRRKNYDLFLIGINVLLSEGWKPFWERYNSYKLYRLGIKPDDKKYYFQQQENETKNNVDTIIKEIAEFKFKPLISIIMPTWNTPKKILKEAIKSVLNQIYSNWELCIADGNSRSETKQVLNEFVKSDNRIKVKFLSENLNISENSNQAIKLATGEFIGLLDHDDELTFDALYEVVKLLQKHPEADLIYSDEDKIDKKGNRSGYFFKPDWSPDLLLSQNYISHFGVYRKSIVDKINGFRIGYEGSQDYDLVLRFTELTKNIYHIPQILYHWRKLPNSVASDPNAKKYAYDRAIQALSDAMQRRKIPVKKIDEIKFRSHYRIQYKIRDDAKVSIIIPTKDNRDYLEKCLNSIFSKTRYQNYEIIIINNQSCDLRTLAYFDEIKGIKKVRIIEYNKKFNYSAMNNFAVNFTNGRYLLFLNDDTEIISPGWITSMLEYCQRNDVGAVGAKLLFPDDTIQHAGVILCSRNLIAHSHKHIPEKYPGYFTRPHIAQNISAVTGACLMVNKVHFLEVNGFDEKNLTIMFNDIDLCLKLSQKKYLNIYTPFAKLYHHESVSRGYEITPKIQAEADFMCQKWEKLLGHDPYYNQNLSKIKEDFSFRYI